jgi:cell wall-associated NlpC family hydrolase
MSRTLGDLRWLNEYVGIPYVWGGRDINGLDCYGLCALLYKEQYDMILPDWIGAEIDLRGRENEISKAVTSGDFTELQEPTEGCFAVCYRSKVAHHLGLYFGGCVLHSHRTTGVVFEPLHQFVSQFGKVVYGDWTPNV